MTKKLKLNNAVFVITCFFWFVKTNEATTGALDQFVSLALGGITVDIVTLGCLAVNTRTHSARIGTVRGEDLTMIDRVLLFVHTWHPWFWSVINKSIFSEGSNFRGFQGTYIYINTWFTCMVYTCMYQTTIGQNLYVLYEQDRIEKNTNLTNL